MSGAIKINGTSSGSTTITAPASGGDESIELSTALAAKANTADIVAPGLVLVTSQSFSAASSVSVNNCFTSTYDTYQILASTDGTATANLNIRLRASGADNSTNNYYTQNLVAVTTTVSSVNTQATSGAIGTVGTTSKACISVVVYGPAMVAATALSASGLKGDAQARVEIDHVRHAVSAAFDGFTLYPASGTITGTLRVYGYRNS